MGSDREKNDEGEPLYTLPELIVEHIEQTPDQYGFRMIKRNCDNGRVSYELSGMMTSEDIGLPVPRNFIELGVAFPQDLLPTLEEKMSLEYNPQEIMVFQRKNNPGNWNVYVRD